MSLDTQPLRSQDIPNSDYCLIGRYMTEQGDYQELTLQIYTDAQRAVWEADKLNAATQGPPYEGCITYMVRRRDDGAIVKGYPTHITAKGGN